MPSTAPGQGTYRDLRSRFPAPEERRSEEHSAGKQSYKQVIVVQCGMCLHSGGPYRNQRKNGERSKAILGLGLDEDYHSLDRHLGEGTQTEAAAV